MQTENFDIDIAIIGGNTLSTELIAEKSPFEFDIARLEFLPEHFRKLVLERGIAI